VISYQCSVISEGRPPGKRLGGLFVPAPDESQSQIVGIVYPSQAKVIGKAQTNRS